MCFLLECYRILEGELKFSDEDSHPFNTGSPHEGFALEIRSGTGLIFAFLCLSKGYPGFT